MITISTYVRNLKSTGDAELLAGEMRRITRNSILWLCFVMGLVSLLLFLHPESLLMNLTIFFEFFVLALPIAFSGEAFLANFLRFHVKTNQE